MKNLQNALLILLLAVVALAVFGLSFKMGEMLFLAYKATEEPPKAETPAKGSKPFLRETAFQDNREIPSAAIAPTVQKPAEKEEAKIGANGSAPMEMVKPASVAPAPVEPASGKVGKVGNTGMKKNMILMPAENFSPPPAKVERPAAASPEASAPAARTAASLPAVPPAAKPAMPAPKPETAAKETRKRKEYKVVAASYSAEASADQLIDRLKAKKYAPVVVEANLSAGRYYRVIVGSHGSLSEAHREMAELKKLGLHPFCIVE